MLHLFTAVVLAALTNADEAFARGDFTAAFREYNDAIIANPNDEEAVLGMGTLDLYRNDWQNARTYLERAQHLAPSDARVIQRLHTLRRRLPKPGIYHFDIPTGRADLPLVAGFPVPVVRASINNHTFTLLVDSRRGSIDLTPNAAQIAGAKDAGLLDSFAVLGLTVTGVPVHVLDGPLAVAGAQIDGAIGTVFLSHFLPTFDPAHGVLTLRRWEASTGIEARARSKGAAIEPMWLVGDDLLVTPARVDGGPVHVFSIDTALNAGVGVPDASAAQALVSLGSYTQSVATAQLQPSTFAAVPFEVGGSLGAGFWRPATVTLDFAAMNVVVAR